MIPVESDNGHLTATPAPSSLNFQSRSFICLRSTPDTASMLTSGWPREGLWPHRRFWKIQIPGTSSSKYFFYIGKAPNQLSCFPMENTMEVSLNEKVYQVKVNEMVKSATKPKGVEQIDSQ